MTNEEKLHRLVILEGYSDPLTMLEEAEFFSNRPGIPAICMNPDCDYTADMEPDQSEGWCEICKTNTVKSAYVIMGII